MTSAGILAFGTSNYDAMIKFLADFGFQVTEDPRDQLVPLFNNGRGARIQRGDLVFNLEESSCDNDKAAFNLFLTDYSDEEIERIKALGYEPRVEHGLYGPCHSFRTPDGGTFVL